MNNLPILKPLLALFRSRKFLTAVISVIVSLLVTLFPSLETIQGPLINVIMALGLAVIGGIAWEDAAKAGGDAAAQPPRTIEELLRELGYTTIDELLNQHKGNPSSQAASVTISATSKSSNSPAVIPEGKG